MLIRWKAGSSRRELAGIVVGNGVVAIPAWRLTPAHQIGLLKQPAQNSVSYIFYKWFKPSANTNRAQTAIKIIAFIIVAATAPGVSQAAQLARTTQAGVVTRVVDGDTVWVQLKGLDKPLKVRLEGIDAPEICQSGGVRAQIALSDWIMGQSVTVITRTYDDYGRTVGTVYLQGQDVARWMVSNGHAWVYTFRSKNGAYSSEFSLAQTERRGVFYDAQPQEPRVFRKIHGACRMSAYRPTK